MTHWNIHPTKKHRYNPSFHLSIMPKSSSTEIAK
jgi:hypothetical protein